MVCRTNKRKARSWTFPSLRITTAKPQVHTLPKVPYSLFHAYLRPESQYCPARLTVMIPPRFIAMRITISPRYLCDCIGQRRMMSSERVKISSSKKTHPLTARAVEPVTSSKLPLNSPLPLMSHRGGPIDAHIARFHATHRNGIPTTPRSQVVLQEYLKYDRGMASPLVSTPSLATIVSKVDLVDSFPRLPFPSHIKRSHMNRITTHSHTNITSLAGL